MADATRIGASEKPDMTSDEPWLKKPRPEPKDYDSDERLRREIIEEYQMDIAEKATKYLVVVACLGLVLSLLTKMFPAFFCGI